MQFVSKYFIPFKGNVVSIKPEIIIPYQSEKNLKIGFQFSFRHVIDN